MSQGLNLQFSSILGLVWLLTACASAPVPQPIVPASADQLLRLPSLASAPISTPPIKSILAHDASMQAFVDASVDPASSQEKQLAQLLRAMRRSELLNLEYDVSVTLNARDTFHQREGNCLSFTNLFISLARLAGLSVRYQLVDIPPNWLNEGNWVILDKHINAVLPGISVSAGQRRDFVVDFNQPDFRGNYHRRVISDEHAFALYYNNQGVEELFAGNHVEAYKQFHHALQLEPSLASAWINLGALFNQLGEHHLAYSSFHQALKHEPRNQSAMASLTHWFERQGDVISAAQLRSRVERYRQRNPYFHYQKALDAYERREFDQARRHVAVAIRRKRDEHLFYFLNAQIAKQLGEVEQARLQLELAIKNTADTQQIEYYRAALASTQ